MKLLEETHVKNVSHVYSKRNFSQSFDSSVDVQNCSLLSRLSSSWQGNGMTTFVFLHPNCFSGKKNSLHSLLYCLSRIPCFGAILCMFLSSWRSLPPLMSRPQSHSKWMSNELKGKRRMNWKTCLANVDHQVNYDSDCDMKKGVLRT